MMMKLKAPLQRILLELSGFMKAVFILRLDNLMYLTEITHFFVALHLPDTDVVPVCCSLWFAVCCRFVCHYVFPHSSCVVLRFLSMCQAQLSDSSDNMQSEC